VNPKYNSLKKSVLKVLAAQEKWISVPVIAQKVNLQYSFRGLYSYLHRLRRFGLVELGRGKGRRVYYRITQLGIDRLEHWASTKADGRMHDRSATNGVQ
jgi:DNA-binding PadR family transcriptional regulator